MSRRLQATKLKFSNNMHVVFRVDASAEIGAGHFMRCLTLARGFKAYSHEVIFLCRHLTSAFEDLLVKFDILFVKVTSSRIIQESHITSNEYIAWLGVSQEQDAFDTLDILGNKDIDWLVVDHYALDEAWEKIVKPHIRRLMVIDDLANRAHICDVLLDQNHYQDKDERYSNHVPNDCQTLLGPHFALLRPEFRELRKSIRQRNGIISKVLVSFGGVDVNNYTEPVIQALSRIEGIQSVDIVIGDQHPFKKEIINKCANYNFKLHIQTEKIAELITRSDFAIGASGSTTWERCCLGLPSLVIPIAENQKAIAIGAKILKVHDLLEIETDVETEIYTRLMQLQNQQNYVSQLSINGMDLVDGLGVNRVIERLHQ